MQPVVQLVDAALDLHHGGAGRVHEMVRTGSKTMHIEARLPRPAIAAGVNTRTNHERSQPPDRHRCARSMPRACDEALQQPKPAPARSNLPRLIGGAILVLALLLIAIGAADGARVFQQGHHGQPIRGREPRLAASPSAAPTSRSRPLPAKGDRLVGARSAVAGSVEDSHARHRAGHRQDAPHRRLADQGRRVRRAEARRLSHDAAWTSSSRSRRATF